MKTIIAGSRTILDYSIIEKAILESPYRITEVISGGAIGPDSFGEFWAGRNRIPIKRILPDWKTYGNSAGVIRNKEMAEESDCAIIFWDGVSKGTSNMIENMKILGKPYILIKV